MSDFIATLVAPERLQPGDISAACDAVGGVAGDIDGRWSVQISFPAFSGARDVLEAALPHLDVIVRPADAPFPRLLVADMDSTIITVECIDELADYAGIKPEVAAITERAMRGEIDFRAALTERVALLAGLRETVIDDCLAERVKAAPGAIALVGTLACFHKVRCVLVSGGFTRFAQPVADRYYFHAAVANVLEIEGGVLTGRVLEPIIDSRAKLATLDAECAALGITRQEVLAVGDGANDIPMLEAAGFGVAYHGHPHAVAAADAAIRHTHHGAILWALGIGIDEWCR